MNKYITILIGLLLCGSLSNAQTLNDYFKIAAENNLGLQSVYKEYEAELQKIPQVKALPDPTLAFGYAISMAERSFAPHELRLSLNQMFPWFGTLKAQGDVAALMAEAKFQSFLDAQNKLYFQVAAAYYPLYELNDWIKIEMENIDILYSYKNIATKKFENGNGAMLDVLRVDIMLKDAETNLAILKNKLKPLTTTFNKLLNRPENETLVFSDSLKSDFLGDYFRKDSLLINHPVLNALDAKIEASNAAVIVAQKQGQPKFGVGLEYVMSGKSNDMLMPMLSMSIPIYRNKYKASIKEAKLMQESYSFQKKEATNMLISNYEMAWFELQQQQQLISLYEQQKQTSQQSLDLLFSAYGNSGKEFEEVLRMQQELLKYRKMSATALSQYQIAKAKINYITAKTD